MILLRVCVARLTSFLTTRHREAQLSEEIQAHLDVLAEEHVRRGLPVDEARRAARREFGRVAHIQEIYRAEYGLPLLDAVRQDVSYACRTLTSARGFTSAVVLTLALGMGATTAIFSVVDAVLLQPLPFVESSRLMLVYQEDRRTKAADKGATPANFLDWRIRSRSFDGLAAFRNASLTLAAGDRPEQVLGAVVTGNFFDVLGVSAAMGRALTTHDEPPAGARVAVISHGLWRERFGGRTDIVGRSVRVNNEIHAIVGVMPEGLDFPTRWQIWITSHWAVPDDSLAPNVDPSGQRGHSYFQVLGRLSPGVTREQAQTDMDRVASTLEQDYPGDNANVRIGMSSVREYVVGDVRLMLVLLSASVGLLLLIAGANVAGLLVARTASREQEIALRVALGATPARIVAQFLIESVLLASLGGATGVLIASASLDSLVALSPADLRTAAAVHINGHVLLFGLAITLATGLASGLASSRQLLRLNVQNDRNRAAFAASGTGPRRLRTHLVAGEMALSLVLLVSAGLTIGSLIKLHRESAGFDPRDLLTAHISLPDAKYPTPEQKLDFWNRTLQAIERIPRVRAAAAANRLPMVPGNSGRSLVIPGAPANLTAGAGADYRVVTPGYFTVMRIPILTGRAFTEADRSGEVPVAIVSAAMATRFWPNGDALGRSFAKSSNDVQMTVIGIAGDVHHSSLEDARGPAFYVPLQQDAWAAMTVAVRVEGRPTAIAPFVRDAVWSVDKDQAIGSVMTMEERLSSTLSRHRFGATLFTTFGIAAATLAAVGLYGVLAFIVSQRRREIGVRMALGATRWNVLSNVMGQGARLASVGIVGGLALAAAANHLLSSLLYGTSPTDATTFAAVAGLLVVVSTAASVIPAIRATRVDPLIAIRTD